MNIKNSPLLYLRDYTRKVASEGMVLLENKNNILPLINKKIALFGRIQMNYYKSGTGSGGLVNVTDVPNFVDAVFENPRLDINKKVLNKYNDWLNDNPFNDGDGSWASEPWSQEEMELSKDEIKTLKREDEIAVVVIGRTAGEDRDNYDGEGSYKLTKKEYDLLKNIKDVYKNLVLILNVGNLIDLNFVKELKIDALLMAWHGGQDGARATIDVLTGFVNPSGKLPSTAIKDLNKYPANNTFGNPKEIFYEEDIYVGYRFFETFLKDEVIYPFGYGLSYTNFKIKLINSKIIDKKIKLELLITNVGDYPGKEVIQIYYKAPQGKLGKPKYQLIAFAKTKTLKPCEKQEIHITFNINDMNSYDDLGIIKKSSYVLEKGIYEILYGNSVRKIKHAVNYQVYNDEVLSEFDEALAPYNSFKRIKPLENCHKVTISYENTPKRTIDYLKRIEDNLPNEIKKNSRTYKLIDVYNKRISLDEFVGSLTYEDLKYIVIGEGMSSPKVTAGTASAFGGVTDELLEKGIPVLCTADGPSGIRMDSGNLATSLPNGSLLASTFNQELVISLYELLGIEMNNYNIDIILGPGINIQRHPLNGRNFEYFSEDPLLTGIMASAFIKGLHKQGVFGAIKHFAANNQEYKRNIANSIISERALREIYLKPYEIAIKSADAKTMMTSYNPINGIYAASNYDLNTVILRKEWKFDGFLMTDWWATMNNDNDEPSSENLSSLVKSQNDVYMVTPNAKHQKNNIDEQYRKGVLKLSELQRNAKNILKFIMLSPTFRKIHNIIEFPYFNNQNWFETNEEEVAVIPNNIQNIFKEKYNDNIPNYDLKETKNNITYIMKDDELKVYGITQKEIVNEFDDLYKKIGNDVKIINLPDSNKKIELDLMEAFNFKNINNWKEIPKNTIYTYKVSTNSRNKYKLSFEISSHEPNIHQMPFTVYVDNLNKFTLTTNGTLNEIVDKNIDIIIDKENRYLSFKFHKTGITIHKITIQKI